MVVKLLTRANNLTFRRSFRLFAGILSILHGIIRLGVFHDAVFNRSVFGSDIVYGAIILVLGVLLIITSCRVQRFKWYGRTIAVLLAAIYAAFGVSIFSINTSSACTSLTISLFLLLEAIMIYDT